MDKESCSNSFCFGVDDKLRKSIATANQTNGMMIHWFLAAFWIASQQREDIKPFTWDSL